MPTRIEDNTFANPEKKSLEQLTFQIIGDEDGIIRSLPALNKHWTNKTDFGNYISLMSSVGRSKTGVELEEWQYEAEHCRENFEYLLNCRHHEFWSYMVYQKNTLSAIVTFLQRATPFYLDIWSQVSDSLVIDLYEEILSLVLRIICRLITNKESAEAWIAKEQQRELIYKNFLISVPMLFDLLVAVGDADAQNAAVLRRVFETLLQIEPNYKEDLQAALAFFRAAFRSIQTQAENEGFEGAGGGAAEESAETPYDDVALYTLDCAYSLSVLLEVCPEVRELCAEIKMGQSIAHFYDSTIPFLYKNIFLVNENANSLAWLNQARLQYLRAFRSIAYCYVETVLMKPEDSMAPSENYVGLLTECLSEQIFVIDYQRGYPVELDMEILRQACKDLDDFKATFVVQGYQKEAESLAFGTMGNIALTQGERKEKPNHITRELDITLASQRDATMQVNGTKAGADPIVVRDIDLEVTAVLDVLPHLGTGFVRCVLSRYENSEEAIAAILEENLPPDLVNADKTEAYIPLDPQDKLYQQTGIKHYNVFDGDAYDVMTQDDPNCIIKQGKGFPNAPQNAAQLLDDKRDLEQIRHRYQEYSLVAEGDNENDEYEDEYDDSYEALLESETRVIKSKELKAGLANVDDVSDTESDEETETQTSGNNRRNNNDFCENPENVRARYEAQRQAKWGQRGGRAGGAGVEKSVPNRNVVGAPRGQGQDKDTLRNRDKKEKNKSSRANHNRKAGAAFKRNKGMMG